MGTYLSTPASEKYKEWGEDLDCPVQPLRFAVIDMQGWRKSMEDAHVVETTVPYPPGLPYLADREKIPKAKVFGVFDGHGGPEVARFCQLYLVSVLTKQELWQEPETAKQEEKDEETKEKSEDAATPGENSAAAETGIGKALISSFHALDRMIDDPTRRDEIIRLRTQKAPPTERRDAGTIPPIKPIVSLQGPGIVNTAELAAENVMPPPPLPTTLTSATLTETATNTTTTPEPSPATNTSDDDKDTDSESDSTKDTEESSQDTTDGDKSVESETSNDDGSPDAAASEAAETKSAEPESTPTTTDETTPTPSDTETPTDSSAASDTEKADQEPEKREDETSGAVESQAEKDYDSDEAVGKEEAAREQGLEDDDDESNDDVQINPYDGAIQVVGTDSSTDAASENPAVPANKVTVMFQRLLNMNENQSGQMVIRVAGEDAVKADGSDPADQIQAPVHAGPSASSPSILQNGRLICNLPDHPIHAGCTAVVAVLLGMTLTVANAGDSRGVLCREGGKVDPLSFDHKPQQAREMTRINNAGGFVNRFGRVNGNLNLSRSIGDLKYKQVPGIAPADQMITAQPDILQVTLQPKDEFFILGCDGIWDCLTNEKAVEFVRERIDTKEPKEIGEEMLNTILSDDPRATQGIGGDNMTVLIVDLQPASRSYKVDPTWGPPTPAAL